MQDMLSRFFENKNIVYQTEVDSIGKVYEVITDFKYNTEANWTVPSLQFGVIGVIVRTDVGAAVQDTIEVYNNGTLVHSESRSMDSNTQDNFMIIVQLQPGSVQLKTTNSTIYFQYVSYTQLNNYESTSKSSTSITITSDAPGTKIILTDSNVSYIGDLRTTNIGSRVDLNYAIVPVQQGKTQTFDFSNTNNYSVVANAVVLGDKRTVTSMKNIKNIQRGYLIMNSTNHERTVSLIPPVNPQKTMVILGDNTYVKLFQTNSITLAAIQAPSATITTEYQLVEFW